VKDGTGLGEAYGATLERIKAQGGGKTKLAMAALMWICHAERALQVDELRHALAVEIGSTCAFQKYPDARAEVLAVPFLR